MVILSLLVSCAFVTSKDFEERSDKIDLLTVDSAEPSVDTGEPLEDLDGDGFDSSEDCDDTDGNINPEQEEIALDGIDQNCDGKELCYEDFDGDGFGSENQVESDDLRCSARGVSSQTGDCDDTDETVNPGATDSLFLDLDCVSGIVDTSLANADYIISGENNGDVFGGFVKAAGDVDGDGLDDLFIGAIGHSENGTYSGKAYIVLGSSLLTRSSIDIADADYSFVGYNDFESVGQTVTSAGDVDGDGKDDVLISAPGNSEHEPDAGMIYLFLGSSLRDNSSITLAEADYAFHGENRFDSVAMAESAGDVDGDGLGDIIIGTGYNSDVALSAGKAYLILGANLGDLGRTISLADADYTFFGVEEDGYAGESVSSAGDVDGDGLDDILIGATGATDYRGNTYLVLGSTIVYNPNANDSRVFYLSEADHTFIGQDAGDGLGASVSPAGDVDGDGLADILLGAPDRNNFTGSSYLIFGSSLSSSIIDVMNADYIFEGEGEFHQTGFQSFSGGDVDGNGLDDIIIGAFGADDLGANSGKVYLTLASNLDNQSLINLANADYTFLGEQKDDFAGAAASITGDIDGDGKDDVVVGAFGANNGDFTGKVYVILSDL